MRTHLRRAGALGLVLAAVLAPAHVVSAQEPGEPPPVPGYPAIEGAPEEPPPAPTEPPAAEAPAEPAAGQEGVVVQTRGPVHEAYAQAYERAPEPGPVVARRPPEPVPEEPPDQKP